ncbi:CLIP domain-containing serine protease 14D-like [Lucilia cuprina]|uniref:CLIP domain-containing serine protease 14D-like n=1 Tax=Lucilia cuprina TaxID=7375 RepID=UPI001F05A768|nr:CLIP domain-containing serine protease 14D-like [Lucilia cuprina]
MSLRYKNIFLIALCLATTIAYPKIKNDCNKKLTNEKENNNNINKNCESNQQLTIESKEQLDTVLETHREHKRDLQWGYSTSSKVFFPDDEYLLHLGIPYINNDKAIEILHAGPKSLDPSESPKSTETTTIPSTTTSNPKDKSSSDDIPLSELTNLSLDLDDEVSVGQKIEMKLSDLKSDTDSLNPTGVEILKNTSLICGSSLGKRISFANETTLMEFPWTALLLYNTKIRYHCGGSLITTQYVLTAAHCVAQEFYELNGVRLGEHDVTEDPDCAPDLTGNDICATTVDAAVLKIIVHHAYSHLSFKNDIALLKLDKEYLSRSFYPICIPPPDMAFNNGRALVAGWGATEKTIRSAILLKAEVPILDISKCREVYRNSVFNDSTEICGSGVNEIDVCKGDSGGAIFYRQSSGKREKYHMLGIISLGVRRCGDSRFLPAVFTKLNGFYKWIENNLEL